MHTTRVDPHELAQQRSLELHCRVAAHVLAEPSLIPQARERIVRRLAGGNLSPEYAQAWLRLLDGPLDSLLAALTDPSETGRSLRQTTPFTFVIGPRERWQLWREVRRNCEEGR